MNPWHIESLSIYIVHIFVLVYSALIEFFCFLDVIFGKFPKMSSTGWWHTSSPWLPSMLHAMAWSVRPLGNVKPDLGVETSGKTMKKHTKDFKQHLTSWRFFFGGWPVRRHGKQFGTKWPTWQLGVTKSCRRWQFQIFQPWSYPPAVEAGPVDPTVPQEASLESLGADMGRLIFTIICREGGQAIDFWLSCLGWFSSAV